MSWNVSRMRLGSNMRPVGVCCGASWGLLEVLFGASWGPRGASEGLLGGLVEPPGGFLGPRAGKVSSSTPSGRSPGAVLGTSGFVLGTSGAVLVLSGAVLGASGAVLGRSCGPLGPSWSVGKPKRRKLQKPSKSCEKSLIFASCGPLRMPLEASWGVFGASWTFSEPS